MSSVHTEVSSLLTSQSSFEHDQQPLGGQVLNDRRAAMIWYKQYKFKLHYQRGYLKGGSRRNWLCFCFFVFFMFRILEVHGVRSFNVKRAGNQNESCDLSQLAGSRLQFEWVDFWICIPSASVYNHCYMLYDLVVVLCPPVSMHIDVNWF